MSPCKTGWVKCFPFSRFLLQTSTTTPFPRPGDCAPLAPYLHPPYVAGILAARCSPRCSSLLVSPTHRDSNAAQLPRAPTCPLTLSPYRSATPIVLRCLFFFAVLSTPRLAPVSSFSMHISSRYSRCASTPVHVASPTSFLLNVLPPNSGTSPT